MLQLPRELTYRQARSCLVQLRPQVQAFDGAQVRVDASGVEVFDSSALAVLLACRRTAKLALPRLGLSSGRQGALSGDAVGPSGRVSGSCCGGLLEIFNVSPLRRPTSLLNFSPSIAASLSSFVPSPAISSRAG